MHRFIAAAYARRLGATKGCDEVARIAAAHLPSVYAGAYEGADCQIMPLALCDGCGRVVGLGHLPDVPLCEYCGGTLRPYRFHFAGQDWDALSLHGAFYVRSHLGLPVSSPHSDRSHLPLDATRSVWRNVLCDAFTTAHAGPLISADPGRWEWAVAFVLGWITHVVADLVMKGFWPETVTDTSFVDGLYGPKSRMAWEHLILSTLCDEMGISGEGLLYGLPGGDDNGIMLHYMMVNEPARYTHWDPPVPNWPARPDQHDLLSAHLVAHRAFFAVLPLTSQFVAGQHGSRPPGERTPVHRLEQFTLDGMDAAELIALARRSGAPEALARIVDLAVAETKRALAATPCGGR